MSDVTELDLGKGFIGGNRVVIQGSERSFEPVMANESKEIGNDVSETDSGRRNSYGYR